MAAIDNLNSTLTKFGTGLSDAKAALLEKGVEILDLNIVNLGEKIRSIKAPVDTFSANASTLIFPGAPSKQRVSVVSTRLWGMTSLSSMEWKAEMSPLSIYFSVGSKTDSTVDVSTTNNNTGIDIRVGTLKLTQVETGKTISITLNQTGQVTLGFYVTFAIINSPIANSAYSALAWFNTSATPTLGQNSYFLAQIPTGESTLSQYFASSTSASMTVNTVSGGSASVAPGSTIYLWAVKDGKFTFIQSVTLPMSAEIMIISLI